MDSLVTSPKNQEFELLSFLWEVIIRTVLNPLFNHNNCAEVPLPGDNVYMSPMLNAHRFEKRLFPYIQERLPRFISNYYTNHVFAQLHDQTDGFNMVTSLQESWHTCAYMTSVRLEEALRPLEDAYRLVVQDIELISIRKLVIHQFRTSVYDKLLGSVQHFGFSCVSKNGIITDRDGLWSVHMLIESVSNDTMTPRISEWDRPVMDWIFETIEDTIDSWTAASVKSFLEKVCFRLLEYRSVFMYRANEFEAKRRLLRAVSGLRDKLIFNNDTTNLHDLLQKEESVPELKRLFLLFHDDEKFLQTLSARSSECFKQFLVGSNNESDEGPLRNEGVFRRFLLTWKRMHSILRSIGTKRAFGEAILAPLTRTIGNCSNNLGIIWHTQKFLAEHCHSLLSKNGNGKHMLATSKEEELFEVVSLASYMRSTDAFVEAHRFLLSKRLLRDTSVSQTLENVVLQVLSKHDSALSHGIKVILSDAQHWPLYQSEIFSTFRAEHGQVLIEPKVINRKYWPLEEDVGLLLNPQLQVISKHVSGYFKSKHPAHFCSIHSTAGHVIIKTKIWDYKGDSVRIKLTTGQLSLLSLFEKSKKLSVQQICTLLLNGDGNTGKKFVFNLIQSMTARIPVLEKEPKGRNIAETDMIWLNKYFQPKDKLLTLPIPEALKNISKPEDETAFEETEEDLSAFQRQCLETTVVKVLKEEKMIELDVLKQVVFAKVGQKIALGDHIFEKTINRLEKGDFLTIDGYIVKYVV